MKTSTREVAFYSYLIGGIMDIQWNVETMQNQTLFSIVKEFLNHLYGKDEWKKIHVLDAIRYKTRTEIRQETKRLLPSLFIGKAAWPCALPKETPDAKFDIELVYSLKNKVEELRKGDVMQEQNDSGEAVTGAKAPRFHLPAGITPDQLTLDNFRTLTGRRFRITTEQKNRVDAGTLTREAAFVEFIEQLKQESKS